MHYEGAIYHVTIRGVDRRTIFDDDRDRERFVKRLGEAVEEYGVRLYLFCLMANHAHLLVETPRANLSAFMHKLQTAYTVYYNLRHQRAGHLMQGRFGAKPVEGDEYLFRLSRYIHLNPVFTEKQAALSVEERRQALAAYPWSTFQGYAGLTRPFEFVCEGPILALTAAQEKGRRAVYRRFVETGLAQTDGEFVEILRGSRWGVGDEEFQGRVRDEHALCALQARCREDVAFRRIQPQATPEAVLSAVATGFGETVTGLRRRRYLCVARAVAAHLLRLHSGMNQRDIGAWMAMGTGAAVCAQIKRLRTRLAEDSQLAARVEALSTALSRTGQSPAVRNSSRKAAVVSRMNATSSCRTKAVRGEDNRANIDC